MTEELMQKDGMIIKGVGGFYTVEAADALWVCKARGVFRKEKITPLPGDRVVISCDGQGNNTIDTILPRRNELQRPTVANIDRMFLLSSTCEPRPNTLLLDKMTALAAVKNIAVALVITKADLGDPYPLRSIYELAGYPVFCVSPEETQVIGQLRALLKNKISVFVGNSGVGKSTLLNRIEPGLQLETGDISQKLGRGRHTTRHVELFSVTGGYVADTPGFSSLDFEQVQPMLKGELADAFPDFGPYLADCRFTGCAHVNDKGCAVCAAVDAGKIHPSRHESYCALYENIKDLQDWQLKK